MCPSGALIVSVISCWQIVCPSGALIVSVISCWQIVCPSGALIVSVISCWQTAIGRLPSILQTCGSLIWTPLRPFAPSLPSTLRPTRTTSQNPHCNPTLAPLKPSALTLKPSPHSNPRPTQTLAPLKHSPHSNPHPTQTLAPLKSSPLRSSRERTRLPLEIHAQRAQLRAKFLAERRCAALAVTLPLRSHRKVLHHKQRIAAVLVREHRLEPERLDLPQTVGTQGCVGAWSGGEGNQGAAVASCDVKGAGATTMPGPFG